VVLLEDIVILGVEPQIHQLGSELPALLACQAASGTPIID
jgi:hypothetical protein